MKGLSILIIALLSLAFIGLGLWRILGGGYYSEPPFAFSSNKTCAAEYDTCMDKLLRWCTSGGSYSDAMMDCLDNPKWKNCGFMGFNPTTGKTETPDGCDPATYECCYP